ncbi:hypothetical protein SteCoe_244 [Stentor coeruleus]|uniref:Uncharacterized protein n=1 Tax=Stentor coeruleus TaxID=5963 RepID=A0A1R2D4Z5_9CILI|nr:hypothetical protein SteCoe_244 [Stentor coeruleus]
MNFRCYIQNCPNPGFWLCSCEKKIKICGVHALKEAHVTKDSCNIKCIEKEYKNHLTDIFYAQNALSNLSQNVLKASSFMINQINSCTNENLYYIKEKYKLIDQAVILGNSELLISIINWAKNFDINQRDKTFFTSSVINLLSLKNDYAQQSSEITMLKSQIDEIQKNYHNSCEEIESLKKELENYRIWYANIEKEKNLLQESYEKLLNEVDLNSKKYLDGNWKSKKK